MSVKLRLLRKGRKRKPFYYVVAADSRAPRDGRYIERVGSYNPNTDPATIDIDLDLSVKWLQDGAQPTDTVRAILSYKGAMHKDHLLRGAAKGAFPIEEVETRFSAWMAEKEERIDAKRSKLADAKNSKAEENLQRETKIRQAKEKAIIAKNTPPEEEVTEGASSELVTDEVAVTDEAPETTEEVVAEAAEEVATEANEEVVAEAAEDVVAEATEEVAAEATEEVVAETTEEVAAEATEEVVAEANEEVVAETTEEVVEATEEEATNTEEEKTSD